MFVGLVLPSGLAIAQTAPANSSQPTAVLRPIGKHSLVYTNVPKPFTLSSGQPGTLSVVADGELRTQMDPVILRNNTSKTLMFLVVKATVTDPNGAQIGQYGDGAGSFAPDVVYPGDYALGQVFINGDVPAGSKVKYQASGTDVAQSGIGITDTTVAIRAVAWTDQGIIITFQNPSTFTVKGDSFAVLICLDSNNVPTDVYANENPLGQIPSEKERYLPDPGRRNRVIVILSAGMLPRSK